MALPSSLLLGLGLQQWGFSQAVNVYLPLLDRSEPSNSHVPDKPDARVDFPGRDLALAMNLCLSPLSCVQIHYFWQIVFCSASRSGGLSGLVRCFWTVSALS